MPIGASRARFNECNPPSAASVQNKNQSKTFAIESKIPSSFPPKSFIDVEFPPCDESINKTVVKASIFQEKYRQQETTTGFDRIIQWRRPIDYLNTNNYDRKIVPKLFPSPEDSRNVVTEVKDVSKGNLN